MKDGRIIRHGIAWEPAHFDGANRSGYEPLDDHILVKMDTAAASTGGIFLTDDAKEKNTLASETGVIIACGPSAFAWNESGTQRWVGEAPGPGDRVYVSKYAGQLLHGDDGQVYRVMDSRCIGARRIQRPVMADISNPVPWMTDKMEVAHV